jgi:hypothetical protein
MDSSDVRLPDYVFIYYSPAKHILYVAKWIGSGAIVSAFAYYLTSEPQRSQLPLLVIVVC